MTVVCSQQGSFFFLRRECLLSNGGLEVQGTVRMEFSGGNVTIMTTKKSSKCGMTKSRSSQSFCRNQARKRGTLPVWGDTFFSYKSERGVETRHHQIAPVGK